MCPAVTNETNFETEYFFVLCVLLQRRDGAPFTKLKSTKTDFVSYCKENGKELKSVPRTAEAQLVATVSHQQHAVGGQRMSTRESGEVRVR